MTKTTAMLRRTAFAAQMEVPEGAVQDWIDAQARIVRQINRNGDVTCYLMPAIVGCMETIECVFQTGDGNDHIVDVRAGGTTSLDFERPTVPNITAALVLIGLLLEEVEMPALVNV